MSHHVFSDDFPTECIEDVYTYARTQAGNKRDVLRSACVVADYGSQFVLGEPVPEINLPAGKEPMAALADALEPCTKATGPGVTVPKLPWSTILPLLFALLKQLFGA